MVVVCGGLRWCVVVCGGLWWIAVVCLLVIPQGLNPLRATDAPPTRVDACRCCQSLRAAYDKHGETQCTTSLCLTLYIDGFIYSFATVCSL